jgi:hypothetical protein
MFARDTVIAAGHDGEDRQTRKRRLGAALCAPSRVQHMAGADVRTAK